MARAGTSKKERGTRPPRNAANQNAMPDVYQEMLVDAVSSSPSKFNEEGQPAKRRRVGGRVVEQGHDEMAHYQSDQASTDANNTDLERSAPEYRVVVPQTAYIESGDSADSNIDWEEVDLKETAKEDVSEQDIVDNQELNLVLGGDDLDTRRQSAPRRKPVSAGEKQLRLEIHKMHLLSLLVHVHRRNHWCNDEDSHVRRTHVNHYTIGTLRFLQKTLQKLLSKRTISYLNPDSQKSQFQRSRSFVDGLTQALEVFRDIFRITARGMSRSYWADSPEDLANV